MEAPEPIAEETDAIIRAMFGDRADDARELLLCYGDREVDRVRRGILKLSEGKIELLAHYSECALQDYRDILYWAEYPDS